MDHAIWGKTLLLQNACTTYINLPCRHQRAIALFWRWTTPRFRLTRLTCCNLKGKLCSTKGERSIMLWSLAILRSELGWSKRSPLQKTWYWSRLETIYVVNSKIVSLEFRVLLFGSINSPIPHHVRVLPIFGNIPWAISLCIVPLHHFVFASFCNWWSHVIMASFWNVIEMLWT